MQRSFGTTLVLTLIAGLLLSQTMTPSVLAQRAPDRRSLAFTAPPLIATPDAKIPVGLRAAAMSVETDGSLARTTLLLTLYNPNDRLLEGTLQFPLQAGQQVSAFALDIGGELRDAVPVPKEKAQQVFESIERRNVDPGLLEQTAGNQFRLRVYPIPARGTRQVRLVIDEAMGRDAAGFRLDVPVHLLAGAETFSLKLRAQGLVKAPEVVGAFDGVKFERSGRGYAATIERKSYRPATGLSLRFPAENTAQSYVQAYDNDRFALIEIPVSTAAAKPRSLPTSVGLLWDASGSARKRDRQTEFALLDRYFKAMGSGRATLRLLRDVGEDGGGFDIRDGDWSALRKVLETTIDDGASDLADWTPDTGIGEYLLVSDGLQNYGDHAFPKLRAGQSLYALNSAGAQADSARLSALSEARGGRLVQWQGRAGLDAAADALLHDGTRIVALGGEGIDDLQPQAWYAEGGLLRVTGRLTEPSAKLRVQLREAGTLRTIEVAVGTDAPQSMQIASLWANWRMAAYAAEPERHRAEVGRLGQRFGIVTPGTSLLVLEAPEDYVRYDIPAPPALREQVAALRRTQGQEKEASRSERLDAVAARFAERQTWFARTFPKGAPPAAKPNDKAIAAGAAMPASAPPPPPPSPMPEAANEMRRIDAASQQRESEESLDRVVVTGSRLRNAEIADAAPGPAGRSDDDSAGRGVSIQLQAWAPDSPYARRLRAASAEDIYAVYLDERDSHASSTAFYLDVADLLLQKGRRVEALRVLSNLAELELENRHVLRVLGYRLMQAKDYTRAVEVFREVLRLADEEPQSHRDLGLALAAAGQRQEGIVHLYDVAARSWDSRFSEVELVALNELNAIIATSSQSLDTAFIDRRLLKNMPLDLRVVLAWDSDNSDMDLWVTDPNGERCYYGNKNTYQGGLISDDFTGGYGPEEFVLKDAKPGKYKVEANFFGDRQQIVTGATTLSMMFSTGWGTRRQQDQAIILRLSGQSETVFVGEFDVF